VRYLQGCGLSVSRTRQQRARPPPIDGSEPMQNDQAYYFSDIFLIFYIIIKFII
jgi:hypothetical protein